MLQFIQGTDEAFRDLEERATCACVRFRSQEMPPGSTPNTADVGFEIDPKTGKSRLHVTRGVICPGCNEDVRTWFASGTKEFASFADLHSWIIECLSGAYQIYVNIEDTVLKEPSNNSGSTESEGLTDIATVENAIRKIHKPLYLDEGKLIKSLSEKVLGQEFAVKGLCTAVARHCARRRPANPAVVFATGESGVGKTRAAMSLSKTLKEQDSDNIGYGFLRLDMAEYSEGHRVSQLIGAPQGYVGHGEGSQLTDTLRSNSKTIVLFDEIEKAHPSILRVLMNAMDAGRLSTASRSSSGREIDCKQAIFIFTSNLNAREILNELESRNAFDDQAIVDEVCRRRLQAAGVLPEIVGRIGRFLFFKPLTPQVRARIITLSIAEVADEYGVEVNYVEPEVIVEIMKRNRSHDLGVRPERYLIDDLLGSAFAEAAKEDINKPVNVIGPPYQCMPINGQNSEKKENEESVF